MSSCYTFQKRQIIRKAKTNKVSADSILKKALAGVGVGGPPGEQILHPRQKTEL